MRTFIIFSAILGLCVFLTSCENDDDAGGGSSNTPITITAATPSSSGSIGSFYQSTFTASGGTGTGFIWSVASGSLPPGLQLIAGTSDATISGTPTNDNIYNFTLEVVDSALNSDTVSHTITISTTTLTIANPATLNYGVMGYEYFLQFDAVGSTSNLTWQMTTGTLPNGITFDAASATLIGVPTQTGSFAFTLEVDDTASTYQRNFSLVIRPSTGALSITTLHVGSWLVGEAVMDPLESVGGSGSGYVWATTAGASLPNGISISNSVGSSMAGTPTQAGTFTFTLEVTDSAANIETRTFTVDVWNTTPSFYNNSLTDNSVFLIAAENTMSSSIASLRSELVAALNTVPSSWSIDVVAYGSQFPVANNYNAKCFGSLTRMTAARKWEVIEFVLGSSLNPGGANSMYPALQDVSNTYPTTLQSLFVTSRSSPSVSGTASGILADSPGWFAGFGNLTMNFFSFGGGGSSQALMQQMAALHGGTYTAV